MAITCLGGGFSRRKKFQAKSFVKIFKYFDLFVFLVRPRFAFYFKWNRKEMLKAIIGQIRPTIVGPVHQAFRASTKTNRIPRIFKQKAFSFATIPGPNCHVIGKRNT